MRQATLARWFCRIVQGSVVLPGAQGTEYPLWDAGWVAPIVNCAGTAVARLGGAGREGLVPRCSAEGRARLGSRFPTLKWERLTGLGS